MKKMNGSKTQFLPAVVPGSFQVMGHYLELIKIHLCLYIGLSGIFGHAMARQAISFDSLSVGGLILILACGAAVLNNIQDREYDSFFSRTSGRSLPQGKVPVSHAVMMAMVMIGGGLSGLLVYAGPFPFFWGLMALIAYNALYTPLKKKSLLALIPGSLCGMMVPLIGWTAAGETLFNGDILIIISVFGLWQLPHFFIILLKTGNHTAKQIPSQRFPCVTHLFSQTEFRLLMLIWTSLYSLAILLLLMRDLINNDLLAVISGLNAMMALFVVSVIVFKNKEKNMPVAFAAINLSMLLFMGAGIWDKYLL